MDFNKVFFSDNRQRILDAVNGGLIVLAANGLLQRSADTTFPFRQDSNFWYLTGVDEPDYVLVCSVEETFLIAPQRPEHRDMWDGAIDQRALKETSGIAQIMEHTEGWNKLDRMLKKAKKAYTITPVEAYFDSFGFYANPARGALLTALKKHRTLELSDIRKPLARLRQYKQPAELAALREAIAITGATLASVQKKLHSYDYEYELAADITAGFMRRGAAGHAYLPIVAAGRNAATIHYIDNTGPLADGGFVLCDVGAEVKNYSADITRTFPLGGAASLTKREKQVYHAVERVQKHAFGLLKPGVKVREYEAKVDAQMAKELKALGLLDDESDKKKLKKYYPHLASHFLGLDTHDAADYDLPLEPWMVLTVEPGIYIPEEGIGVRIEDDVLVTAGGIEVLSKDLPTAL